MPEIRPLTPADLPAARTLIAGYTSSARYAVAVAETREVITFELRLVVLDQPYVKRYGPLDLESARRYADLLTRGHCFGAFAGEGACVGIALCEMQDWNASMVIWEFHIAPGAQRQGTGRQLMEVVAAHAHSLGLRCLACETQTSNVPAIAFYRALGFRIAGLDLALYGNDDQERGEVAIFMKRDLYQ